MNMPQHPMIENNCIDSLLNTRMHMLHLRRLLATEMGCSSCARKTLIESIETVLAINMATSHPSNEVKASVKSW